MASLVGIRDKVSWLADRIPLDCFAIFDVVGEFGVIHGLAFELSPFEVYISWMRKVNDIEEGCFHLAFLASGLRFPFLGFILEILGDHRIMPS